MYKAAHTWWNWRPAAGFRFSVYDAAAIGVCVLATWWAWPMLGEMAFLFPIVLGHFFLFCNVFRIGRPPELLWSAVFVINVAAWSASGQFTWAAVLWMQSPVTVAVIVAAVLRKDYHGVGYALMPWTAGSRDGGGTASRGGSVAIRKGTEKGNW